MALDFSSEIGLSTPAVCRLAGVAPSTLNYWVRTGLVKPSIAASRGKRFDRWWSIADVVLVRAVKALRDAGCPLQTLRKAKAQVERYESEALGDVVLYWDGGDVLILEKWGTLRSAVVKPGQQVLHLVALPLQTWMKETEREAEPISAASLRSRSASRRTKTVAIARAVSSTRSRR